MKWARRLMCRLTGHRDVRIRWSSTKAALTVYVCGWCDKIWVEKDHASV